MSVVFTMFVFSVICSILHYVGSCYKNLDQEIHTSNKFLSPAFRESGGH